MGVTKPRIDQNQSSKYKSCISIKIIITKAHYINVNTTKIKIINTNPNNKSKSKNIGKRRSISKVYGENCIAIKHLLLT